MQWPWHDNGLLILFYDCCTLRLLYLYIDLSLHALLLYYAE